jgi:hypothetical protein
MERVQNRIKLVVVCFLMTIVSTAQDLPADFGDALGDNADDASLNQWYWVLIVLAVGFIYFVKKSRQASKNT